MAHIVTVHILVDDPRGEAAVTDGLNEMFRTSQEPVDPDGDDSPFVLDWAFGEIKPVPVELEDAIVNETYEEGDFTRSV